MSFVFSRNYIVSMDNVSEKTLDPEDWEALKQLGHRMLDDMFGYLETIGDRPVWQPVPDEVKSHFQESIPYEGQTVEAIYEEFLEYILPYTMGNTHPRFWGWVTGTGTPLGMLAEMLTAGLNSHVGGAEHIAPYIETQVINWCKQMLNYPADASGILLSGASMANLIGLTVARNSVTGLDTRRNGLQHAPHYLTVYCSYETHSSIQRAVEVLGLGSNALRRIAVDSNFQIDLEALEKSIADDKAAGYHPLCIVGNAGTVNTGAFDNLNALADICEREKIWFHIDGAFGSLAELVPSLSYLTKGLNRAHSVAFDMHKWLHIPYEAACVLIRDRDKHLNAFTLTPPYLKRSDRGVAAGEIWFGDYGIQLSRAFRALKIWMSIKENGVDKFGQLIQQNVDQAQYLARLIDNVPYLELLAPVSLNIVCFRYKAEGIDDLNRFNEELLILLQEMGVAVPSHTVLNDQYAIRVAITNHRTRKKDLYLLIQEVIKIGSQLQTEQYVEEIVSR